MFSSALLSSSGSVSRSAPVARSSSASKPSGFKAYSQASTKFEAKVKAGSIQSRALTAAAPSIPKGVPVSSSAPRVRSVVVSSHRVINRRQPTVMISPQQSSSRSTAVPTASVLALSLAAVVVILGVVVALGIGRK